MEFIENMFECLVLDILGLIDVFYGEEVYSFKGLFKKIFMFDVIFVYNL